MEQQVLRGLEQHKPLTNERLISQAVLATQMRIEIAENAGRSHGSLRHELRGEYVIAHRHEYRLLGAVAARGLMDDYLEARWQDREVNMSDNEEEMVWQAS